MPQQLTFELAPPEIPGFGNFVAGDNAEVLDALQRVARGELVETSVLLWGAAGSGKSHLLEATVAAASAASRFARYYPGPEAAPADPPELGALVAVDRVDGASAEAQSHLFRLYNALAGTGGQLVAAAHPAPAGLALRADLRTRLAHGLVYEVKALADDAKAGALVQFAASRGFALPADVTAWLLAHCTRDMRSLAHAVVMLDRASLATHRPVSVALARDCLRP